MMDSFPKKQNDAFYEIYSLIGKPLVISNNINDQWYIYSSVKFQCNYEDEIEIIKHIKNTDWSIKKIQIKILLQYNL